MSKRAIKDLINALLSKFGVRVLRIGQSESEFERLLKIYDTNEIDVVIDIGANIGQFAKELRLFGWKKSIISFEPVSQAHTTLMSRAESDNKWVVADRCAIGHTDAEVEIQVSENLVSSSVLKVDNLHLNAAPMSRIVTTETVELRALDSTLPAYILNSDILALKIDVQGLELDVLLGAENIINQTNVIQVELSLAPLYQGQNDWNEILRYLNTKGFEMCAIFEGLVDSITGSTLQFDAIFVKVRKP